jgi:NAD-dependent deacetylase
VGEGEGEGEGLPACATLSGVTEAIDELAGWLRTASRTVVLTGAGISVASGLRPFRGPDGLWTENPELAGAMKAGVSMAEVWRAFGPMRDAISLAHPNPAHFALVALEAAAASRGASLLVITQNVDGLHGRAGQRSLVELHGNLLRTRCSVCDAAPTADAVPHVSPPPCSRCGAALRPDIVLFDEAIGAREEVDSKRAFRDADLFVAIGTSGTVSPAASFARWAKFERARTALVNLTPLEGPDPGYDRVLLGPADELLPRLVR